MVTYSAPLTDALSVRGAFAFGHGKLLADTASVSSQTSLQWRAGAAIADVLRLNSSLAPKLIYIELVQSRIVLRDVLARAIEGALSNGIVVGEITQVAQSVLIANKIFLSGAPSAFGRYIRQLTELMALNDELARFFGGFLTDQVGISTTALRQYQAIQNPADRVTLGDLMSQWMVFRVDTEDDLELDGAALLRAIYSGDMADDIFVTGGYVEPSGSFTTWAVNTRTNAVTEYRDYVFDSFAQMGHRFLGANSSGLWVLDGEVDDTRAIQTRIKNGLMQLAGTHFTSFKAIYLGLRVKSAGSQDFILKMHAGDGREYVYKLRPQNLMTTKVTVGKGLRSRYFSFELISPGEDFDFDNIEFIPITSQRRV